MREIFAHEQVKLDRVAAKRVLAKLQEDLSSDAGRAACRLLSHLNGVWCDPADVRQDWMSVTAHLSITPGLLDGDVRSFILSAEEDAALMALAEAQDLTPGAVIRQALRLYQMTHKRFMDGETMSFSDDRRRFAEFAPLGLEDV